MADATTTAPVCTPDMFQGLRFYDGTSFGYLRVFPDKVQLVIDGNTMSFALNGTMDHTYRVTGHGRDVKLYVDGQLAIDGTGALISKASERLVEFGDIAGRDQNVSSEWSEFKYSVLGAFPPNTTSDLLLEDVASFPLASVGRMKTYQDRLYVSVDPSDAGRSSAVYNFREGFDPENRSVAAITQGGVSCVAVDPSRATNVFGTSGKFLGTDKGLQYLLGSKPFPFDQATAMSVLPSNNGWEFDGNCDGNCASVGSGILTIDTTSEGSPRFYKFLQSLPSSPWVSRADNSTGWTVEVRVQIANDGSGGAIDATSAAAACGEDCGSCGASSVPVDDGISAPSVFINDGTYQEVVQFFQKGVRLKYARRFAPQVLTDQFYTIRVIGKGTALAVYAKGDSEPSFRKLIFDPNGLAVKATLTDKQELPSVIVDGLGTMNAVWQDAAGGNFSVYSSKLVGRLVDRGSGLVGSQTVDAVNSIISSRPGFGLPAAAPGIDYSTLPQNVVIAPAASFVAKGVKPRDVLYVFGEGSPSRSYVISDVLDEILLKIDTSDDLSGLMSAEWAIASASQSWLPPTRLSANAGDSIDPRLIRHSSGDFFVAYANNDQGRNDIFVARGANDPFGVSWKETVRVTFSALDNRAPDMVELPSGDLLVVWEGASADTGGSTVLWAIVPIGSFGTTTGFGGHRIRSSNAIIRKPRVARSGTSVYIAYENHSGTQPVIEVSLGVPGATATKPLVFSSHTAISNAAVESRNPSIAASPDGSIYLAWEDHGLVRGQILASKFSSGAWSAPIRISDSRGSSVEPSVACDGAGNAFVAFSDDRTRDRFFEVYVARFDAASGQWLSSGQRGLDTKIKSYLTDNRRPAIAAGPDGSLGIVWEAYKDGSRNVIAGARYDGLSSSMDTTVVGYFPLDDNSTDMMVQNKVRTFSEGVLQPQSEGTAFNLTSIYSVPSPLPGASLYAPEDQRAFDIRENGFGFKVPGSLFGAAGGIDVRIRPHWYSTFPGTFVFFGNASLTSLTPNTMSCGVETLPGGNLLKFRIVDASGVLHETSVDHNHFQWTAEQDVFLRAVWDSRAIGISSVTGIRFPSPSIGYASGYNGSIFKSLDGGATWSKQATGLTYDLNAVDFMDATHGVVCGEMGTILVTADGGVNWSVATTPGTATLYGICYGTSSSLFAVGENGTILTSSNGGTTWTAIAFSDSSVQFNDVYPISPSVVIAVAAGGKIYRSSNGGATFSPVASPTSSGLNGLSRAHFASGTAYACGDDGVVIMSTDFGQTWSNISPSWPTNLAYKPNLKSVSHAGTIGTIWVVGQGGTIAKSSDSGATWSFVASGTSGAIRAVEAYFDGATSNQNAVFAGIGGLVLRTSDGGATLGQAYTRSDNLRLYINGKAPLQTKTGDSPFSWVPGADVVFGDYQQGGTNTADSVFDELIIYKAPPPNHSAHVRQEIQTFQALAVPVTSDSFGKRIEWGAISQDTKSKSLWKDFRLFFCGAKEPLLTFAWNSTVGLVDDVIRDMAFDANGILWIATENGVSRFDAPAANNAVNAWLSGMPVPTNGLFQNFTNLPSDLIADSVNSIAVDARGNIWAGTDKGLMAMASSQASLSSTRDSTIGSGTVINGPTRPSFNLHLTAADGLPSSRILVVRSSGGFMFVGTDAGLAIIDTSVTSPSGSSALSQGSIAVLTAKNGLPSNLVKAIAFEPSGDVWVGTDRGAISFKGRCNRIQGSAVQVRNSDIYSITIDGGDRKFIGTRFGLTRIDGANAATFSPSSGIGTGAIAGGAFDGDGVLWLATSGGLVEFSEKCGRFTSYGAADGLIGEPAIVNYQNYRILGDDLPTGGCDKSLVSVAVNGRQLAGGFSVNPFVPSITFDVPLLPSDRVDVCVDQGWRRVRDFNSDSSQDLLLETDVSRFTLYRSRKRAGTIVLGGNSANGADTSSHMYAVFAVPISGSGSVVGVISSPPGAMLVAATTEGIPVFSDSPEPIKVVPTELVGANFIRLPSAAAGDITNSYLTFALTADSIVYVAYDSRARSIPVWLRPFEKARSVLRISEMQTFVDGSNQEKLFAATSGSSGCVYDFLADPKACDVSATVAMDASPPTGCAKIQTVNSTSNITLSLQATDTVTGVVDMQVSGRADFTTDGTMPVPFVPFSTSYNLDIPGSSQTVETPVSPIPAGVGTVFGSFNGQTLVGTSAPGRVYSLNTATGSLSLLFDTGELSVLCMAQFGSVLIVGTGITGKVFKWDGTALSQVGTSVGVKASALAAFDNTLFIGSSPFGSIYRLDSNLAMSLFTTTNETKITGFAALGGQLFWSSGNDFIAEGDVLTTTTTIGHRHTIVVQAGETRIFQVSGTTSPVDGHVHQVVNGVVQPANGHTHILNGTMSGKVFRYDIGTGDKSIVLSDKDYDITTIAVTSGTAPVMFAGTYPNGKILRYAPEDGIFIKSFSTPGHFVNALRDISGQMFASVDSDVYFFDGTQWQFSTGSTSNVVDFASIGGNVYLLKTDSITFTPPTSSLSAAKQLCAWVKFRDAAGNVTTVAKADGTIDPCFNPCVSLKDVLSGSSAANAPSVAHRIVEVDPNAKVVFSMNGPDPFYSGNKVEEEVGVYVSEVLNGTNSLVQWVSISWLGAVQAGSSITLAVRSAATSAGIVAAKWSDEFTNPAGNDITNLVGQFLQFRATLTVSQAGVPSPDLKKVDIQLRTSQAVHYFTTNFSLPDNLTGGILTYNGCINPPVTDVVFGVSGLDTTNFSDYMIIEPGRLFQATPQHQTPNLRIAIKLISSPTAVPIVDEFGLLFSLANDAFVRLNLPGAPGQTNGPPIFTGSTRTVITEQVQGHVHTITFDSTITDKSAINGVTSTNAGHSHQIVNGIVQPAAGHTHNFSI